MAKIEGLVLTTFTDMGPTVLLNLSPLEDKTSMKLSINGMTIITMGNTEIDVSVTSRMHGPIPVPDRNDLEAFAIFFTVAAEGTTDERMARGGRITNLWIIFDVNERNDLLTIRSKIEQLLLAEIACYKSDVDLEEKDHLNGIQEKLQTCLAQEFNTTSPSPQELNSEKPLEWFIVNKMGQLEPINVDFSKITSYPILILVNSLIKQIFVIKIIDDVSPRLLFIARKEASNLNVRNKNEYLIRNIVDPLEVEVLLGNITHLA